MKKKIRKMANTCILGDFNDYISEFPDNSVDTYRKGMSCQN